MHRKNSLNAAGDEPGKKSHFGIARADARVKNHPIVATAMLIID